MAKLLFRALLMALSNEIGVCENPIPKIRKVNILKIYLSFYLIYFYHRGHREIIRVHGVLREILCVSVFRFIVGIHLQYLLFLAIFYFFFREMCLKPNVHYWQ